MRCSITGCEKPHVARGFCESHYRRLRRHGDPLAGNPVGLTVEERFWAKVAIAGEDDCWLWTASRLPDGYGNFFTGERRPNGNPDIRRAHRWLYQRLHGDVGALEVCHTCDEPACVNPKHLYAGTHTQNMRDMIDRGRADNSGDRNGRAKLTATEIAEIRSSATGRYGEISELARKYGIASGTMSKILKHQTWK